MLSARLLVVRNLSFYPIDLQLDADEAQRYASDLGRLDCTGRRIPGFVQEDLGETD